MKSFLTYLIEGEYRQLGTVYRNSALKMKTLDCTKCKKEFLAREDSKASFCPSCAKSQFNSLYKIKPLPMDRK